MIFTVCLLSALNLTPASASSPRVVTQTDHFLIDANCDDADVCNGTESCSDSGGCQHGEFLECDDGNVCTADSCDPTSGCQNTPQAGQACGGDDCGVCDAQGGCQPCP